MISISNENRLTVLKRSNNKIVKNWKWENVKAKGAFFRSDDKLVLYNANYWNTFHYNKGPNTKNRKTIGKERIIEKMVFKDGSLLLYHNGLEYGVTLIKDTENFTINNSRASIVDVIEDSTTNRYIVALANGEIGFVNKENKKQAVTLVSKGAGGEIPMPNYFFYTNNNTYFGSRNAYDIASFRLYKEIQGLGGFDLYYNKPAEVIKGLGGSNQEYIDLLELVQKKRLVNTNFGMKEYYSEIMPDIVSLEDSTVSITNEDTARFFLQFTGVGSSNISSISAYVNGVPILEEDSNWLKDYFVQYPRYSDVHTTEISEMFDVVLRIRDKGKEDTNILRNSFKHFRINWSVPLNYGRNHVEFFCTNTKGLRSKVLAFNVKKRNPDNVKPNLYVVALSVSKYQDERYNLKYARKDGRDILARLGKNRYLINHYTEDEAKNYKYENVYIDSFFDEAGTKSALETIKQKLMQTSINDAVVFYISGHGVLDDNLDFWYATHDMDFGNPEKNGISYRNIENLLKDIPARNRLLLMDACHSGEVDRDAEEGFTTTFSNDLNATFKGTSVVDLEPKVGLQNSFELMKLLFTDVSRNSGIQVISAAAGNSYALESDEWSNGIFTYCLLKGLELESRSNNTVNYGSVPSVFKYANADRNRDDEVSVAELQEYVRDLVEEMTFGAQKPTSRQGSIEFDFSLW